MFDAILNSIGIALCYVLAGMIIIVAIIFVCVAIYAQDKANKKY